MGAHEKMDRFDETVVCSDAGEFQVAKFDFAPMALSFDWSAS